MSKEAKNVDFYTTGRQPSEQDFARISEWIKRDKKKQAARELKSITGTKPLGKGRHGLAHDLRPGGLQSGQVKE